MSRERETSHLPQHAGVLRGVAKAGWKWPLLVLICVLLFAGCTTQVPSAMPAASFAAAAPAPKPDNAGPEFRRFIAVRHELLVETGEDELPQAWESIADFCRTIPCDIVASSIRQKTYDSPPSATLSLRIVPQQVKQLMEQIEAVGVILEHKTESTDETAAVIDVEAKIKNLTELRDRLRKMLGSADAGVKDIVEVERELSRAQSELDSLQTTRKALANETEKVSVSISFCARKSLTRTGTFAPIVTAWYSIGDVLAGSIGAVIVFVAGAIPWLLLFIPTLWLCIKAFRKLRGKRGAPAGK
jgi:hypothetical protein